MAFTATPALAAETGAQWTVSSVSRPTNLAVGSSEDSYVVLVTNTGGAPNTRETFDEAGAPENKPVTLPVTITDELPAGLEALPGISAEDELLASQNGAASFGKDCAITGSGDVSCTYSGVVQPDDTLVLNIPVRAMAVGSVTNVVRVEGGGAASAAMETPTSIFANATKAKEATVFGVSTGGASTALSSVQAGAHPDLTTTGAFNTENAIGATVGDAKDITDDLPAGFAGDLIDTPACEAQLFLRGECPIPTQVGVTTQVFEHEGVPRRELDPVYNLTPEPGEVAKIGFSVDGDFFYEGDIAVRAPGEGGAACDVVAEPTACEPYGLKTTFYNASAGFIDYDGFSLTVWGVPTSPTHDALRCKPSPTGCSFGVSDPGVQVPYFTNPTACTSESLRAELHVTSWQEKEAGAAQNPSPTPMQFGPIAGCDRLLMEPSLTAEVTSDSASSATGFDLDTSIPQTYNNAAGLATSTLKQEVVTLPEGMTVNPSSGVGLQACSEAQYAEELAPEPTAEAKEQGHGCPNSSKLATVKIKTPSISEEVIGSAYLAEPAPRGEEGKNPFKSLLALYLIARAKNRGVLVKAPGLVQANDTTGRLTTSFGPTPAFDGAQIPASPGLPPLPASDITFQFNQGANAPLVTPPECGNYTVTAELTPWSNPEDVLDPSIAPFPIATGVGGGACPAGGGAGGIPFNPGITAGTENNEAGSYSPLSLRITRQDGEQEITGFASQLPPGLTANLSGVPFCPTEAIESARVKSGAQEESEPSCPAASEIGQTVADAGVGSVLAQAPGKIYMAGPYQGAPFSVVAITRAKVGPFDLGTVVVHLPLDINPETAAVTIPAGTADQIPHIIKGIVVHVREIRVYINKQDFTLNPTSCNPFNFSATVIGGGSEPANPADNDPVTATTPFRVTACQALKFAPKFAASTSGKTSRANGASLHVDLTYPTNALGSDSNIKQVKVELPKQLPSRLTTLQKACTQAQFKANPAGCPAASLIGTAKAITPILPVALEGYVYFVSNGGEAFPNLIMVLQGDGVTIDLVGDTFISKAGITSSTFKAVPDQPVSSFELTLPEKQYSALAANGSLCAPTKTVTVKKKVTVKVRGKKKTVTRKVKQTEATTLAMPTEFVGQNGATIHQTTPVSVTGCPRVHKAKAKHKAKRKQKGRK